MNDHDLSEALADIVADAQHHGARALPVEAIVHRRRRRRAAIRGASAGGLVAGVAAVALAGTSVAGWFPDRGAPALPDPTPTTSAAPGTAAWPVCGEPLPEGAGDLAVTALSPAQGTAAGPVSVQVAVDGPGAAELPDLAGGGAALAVLRDGRVAALLPTTGEPAWTVTADGVQLALSGPLDDCGAPLAAGTYTGAVAVRTAGGTAVSDPVEVRLDPGEAPTGAADDASSGGGSGSGRPLIDPNRNRMEMVEVEGYDPDEADGSETLADGDYFAMLTAVDPAARTITVDVAQVLTPQETVEHRMATLGMTREEAEHEAPAVEWLNESTRLRTLPVAADVVVTGACGSAPWRETLTLEQVAGPRTSTACVGEDAYPSDITVEQQSWFWVDVRGGQVVQLVGQFMS
ncbi:hypothetical protein [Cellulomonas olei]|uniref:hypothetical protein n=1 Tax=Cellulomonas sp. P4 TaxID=3142533 RepID=UPI0031BAD02A